MNTLQMTEKMTENRQKHGCKKCNSVFEAPNWEDFGVYSQIEFEKEPLFFCKGCYKNIVQFEVSDWLKGINKVDKEEALKAFNREFTQKLDIGSELDFMSCVDNTWTANEIVRYLINRYFMSAKQAYGYLEQFANSGRLHETGKQFEYTIQ